MIQQEDLKEKERKRKKKFGEEEINNFLMNNTVKI